MKLSHCSSMMGDLEAGDVVLRGFAVVLAADTSSDAVDAGFVERRAGRGAGVAGCGATRRLDVLTRLAGWAGTARVRGGDRGSGAGHSEHDGEKPCRRCGATLDLLGLPRLV